MELVPRIFCSVFDYRLNSPTGLVNLCPKWSPMGVWLTLVNLVVPPSQPLWLPYAQQMFQSAAWHWNPSHHTQRPSWQACQSPRAGSKIWLSWLMCLCSYLSFVWTHAFEIDLDIWLPKLSSKFCIDWTRIEVDNSITTKMFSLVERGVPKGKNKQGMKFSRVAAGARRCFNPVRTQLRCFCFMVRRGLGSHSFAFFRLGESRPSSCSKGICSNLRRGMPSQISTSLLYPKCFAASMMPTLESMSKLSMHYVGMWGSEHPQRHICCYPHTCRNLIPAVSSPWKFHRCNSFMATHGWEPPRLVWSFCQQ